MGDLLDGVGLERCGGVRSVGCSEEEPVDGGGGEADEEDEVEEPESDAEEDEEGLGLENGLSH